EPLTSAQPGAATTDAPAKTLTGKQDDALLAVLNRFTNPQYYWSGWVALIWGALLVVRGLRLFVFGEWIKNWRQARLQRL
ncbi:2TM domain-containing protein, partial [Escherichia coli]|nr:2TM domain-containing protein [Escherichia coli]